jgi:hypothetical protein
MTVNAIGLDERGVVVMPAPLIRQFVEMHV